MTNLKEQIFNKITGISFKDGQKLQNLISDIVIKGRDIGFAIDISGQDLKEANSIRNQAIKQIEQINDIGKITIALTGAKKEGSKPKLFIEGVRKVILVAAGKGGVGKSTVAALLAQNLEQKGHRVGILDADIYGPSIPLMFGVERRPEVVDKKMIPLIAHNIQINSIGFLTRSSEAIAWRGPMASKAIYQLLSLTDWQDLDYLIIDMPPGTGDIHLSILENYQISGGVIIVTTPQKIAEIDVEKAINLYQKFNLNLLGIVENMSYLVEPITGNKIPIFSGGSGRRLAEKHNIPLLLEMPIIPDIASACDQGRRLTDFGIELEL